MREGERILIVSISLVIIPIVKRRHNFLKKVLVGST